MAINNIIPETEEEKEMANYWLDQGLLHAKPSKQTIKIYEKMGDELKDVKNIQNDHGVLLAEQGKDIKYMVKAIDKIDSFIDAADTKYASKKTVNWIIISILSSMIAALSFIAKWCWNILMDK